MKKKNGAQVAQVDEPLTTFIVEFTAYPEPKALSPRDLSVIYAELKSYSKAADAIGASEAFVRQNIKSKKTTNKRSK